MPDTQAMRTLVLLAPRWNFPQSAPATFEETLIIYEEHGRYFIERSKTRYEHPNPPNLEELSGTELPVDSTWPAYDGTLTAVASYTQSSYLKKPHIVDVAMFGPESIQKRILSEARVCEEIKRRPHPNLVEYLGCLVHDGKIKGLVLAKYAETLQSRVKRPFDLEKMTEDIRLGIEHLHSIGFIHGDISPGNIMFDADDNAVIIDFDSARRKGDSILDGDKQGTPLFGAKATSAVEENDYYSMTRVQEFMETALQKLRSSMNDNQPPSV